MSLVHISFPNKPENKAIELANKIKEDLNLKKANIIQGDVESIIVIRRDPKDVPKLLEELSRIGVGTEFGFIDIIPLKATVPEIKYIEEEGEEEEEEEKLTSRISIEEIKVMIKETAKPDIQFIVFMILAALVSASALVLNSIPILIASMILSPFMGPILGFSFAIMIKDKIIIKEGIVGQIYGTIISILIGILVGFFARITGFLLNPTTQMKGIGFPNYFDLIISICAGIAVAFSITGTVKSALVGVAIAVAIIVPAVNTGLSLIYGEFVTSFESFILFLTNIILIDLCAIIVFKIKGVKQMPQSKLIWRRSRRLPRKIKTD
ncbi:MAG: TIGR00341 family protein [Promethearchaeota archaeon]|nr:MAG: TIGR00341 family protein [Candidatus Lokiarchaeota archaeon]